MIQATGGKLHWNYFLALERDFEVVARYIELSTANFDAYSIELAHLLFAASSEVDIVAKLLCQQVAPTAQPNINDYKAALLPVFADLPTTEVAVDRYGLKLAPWSKWSGASNPDWWRSYNNVKHERDTHFQEATLKNALKVNTPPAKAGAFGLRLKAGLIGHSADDRPYTTVNSSSGSGGF